MGSTALPLFFRTPHRYPASVECSWGIEYGSVLTYDLHIPLPLLLVISVCLIALDTAWMLWQGLGGCHSVSFRGLWLERGWTGARSIQMQLRLRTLQLQVQTLSASPCLSGCLPVLRTWQCKYCLCICFYAVILFSTVHCFGGTQWGKYFLFIHGFTISGTHHSFLQILVSIWYHFGSV